MTRRNEFGARLRDVAKTISKARVAKLHEPLYDAFVVFAAAGDVARARAVLRLMYNTRIPRPAEVANVVSTAAMDGFCRAARLGDITKGQPAYEPTAHAANSLSARVAEAEVVVRAGLTADAYGTRAPRTDAWKKRAATDPDRAILRWRRIQALAEDGHERDALELLVDLLGEWPRDERGVGYGHELLLAIDLALRNGEARRVPAWVDEHGHRFADESFLVDNALCLPAVAKRITRGMLRDVVGLSEVERASALEAIGAAVEVSLATPPKPPGKVQRRRVTAEYSQVHLEPEHLDATELAQVHFQKRGDSARGMSLFPTRVGIATPGDTDYVDAEITISRDTPREMAGVVQAVAFPIRVRAPLVLASVGGGDDDPFVVPNGTYDVLARFIPKRAPKASRDANLRVFTLTLSFHLSRTLRAPRTIKLES